ncbi:MAG: ATP-binding protein [Pseudomonadales bacterium]
MTGQGAGIGLSFCKMVMDSIGGAIDCESIPGDHTTFTLTFSDSS